MEGAALEPPLLVVDPEGDDAADDDAPEPPDEAPEAPEALADV